LGCVVNGGRGKYEECFSDSCWLSEMYKIFLINIPRFSKLKIRSRCTLGRY